MSYQHKNNSLPLGTFTHKGSNILHIENLDQQSDHTNNPNQTNINLDPLKFTSKPKIIHMKNKNLKRPKRRENDKLTLFKNRLDRIIALDFKSHIVFSIFKQPSTFVKIVGTKPKEENE